MFLIYHNLCENVLFKVIKNMPICVHIVGIRI